MSKTLYIIAGFFAIGLAMVSCNPGELIPGGNNGSSAEVFEMCGPQIQRWNLGEGNEAQHRSILTRVRYKPESGHYVSNNLLWKAEDNEGNLFCDGSEGSNNQNLGRTVKEEYLWLDNSVILTAQQWVLGIVDCINDRTDLVSHVRDTLFLGYAPEGGLFEDAHKFTVIWQNDPEITNFTIDGVPYTHQRWTTGELLELQYGSEIPGDGFDDELINADANHPLYGVLNPNKKDLIIELDYEDGEACFSAEARNEIGSKLQDIFSEIDVDLSVFWEHTTLNYSFEYGERMGHLEARNALARERNGYYNRQLLHIIAAPILPGDGLSVGMLGSNFVFGLTRWYHPQTVVYEYDLWDSLYHHEELLDSVGIIVFYQKFDESNERHESWSFENAFANITAHEIGHALGIFNPEENPAPPPQNGCIMSHRLSMLNTQFDDSWMHFMGVNVQGSHEYPYADIFCISNCICLRDVLGIHTIVIHTGWHN